MLELFVVIAISSAFTFLGYWKPRAWALVVPFVIWLAIARLGDIGIVPEKTTTDAALGAGVVGALFATLGLFLSAGRPRTPIATTAPGRAPGRARSSAPGTSSGGGPSRAPEAARPSPKTDSASPRQAAPPAAPRTSRRRSSKAG